MFQQKHNILKNFKVYKPDNSINNKLCVLLKYGGGAVLRYLSNNKSIIESLKECSH